VLFWGSGKDAAVALAEARRRGEPEVTALVTPTPRIAARAPADIDKNAENG
jgi:hypothetical protein